MKHRLMWLVGILFAATSLPAPAQDPVPDTPCNWSGAVNGLTGRICLSRARVVGGTPLVVATLTLRNSERPSMSVAWREVAMHYSIVDEGGAAVTTGVDVFAHGGSNMLAERPPLIVPRRGEVSFEIAAGGGGLRDKAAIMKLGSYEPVFTFEPTDRPLFLRAVLEIARTASPEQDEWSGRIVFPDVRIPLGLEPANPAKVAATLSEAHALIATGQLDKVIAALDRLSLLGDLRVVPLYMKAFPMTDYTVKHRIINSLGTLLRRFPDGNLDEVMAGLARASGIAPSDAAAADDQRLAAQTAANLRLSVVNVLADSRHPEARKLLTAMASDTDEEVRKQAGRFLTEP
jgi:hypothetical protein